MRLLSQLIVLIFTLSLAHAAHARCDKSGLNSTTHNKIFNSSAALVVQSAKFPQCPGGRTGTYLKPGESVTLYNLSSLSYKFRFKYTKDILEVNGSKYKGGYNSWVKAPGCKGSEFSRITISNPESFSSSFGGGRPNTTSICFRVVRSQPYIEKKQREE